MNYKIAKTMLILCIVYLVAFYILKFFFPEMLLQAITSPTLLRLGEVINTWIGWSVLVDIIGTTITYYLFTCACCGNFKYTKIQIAYIFSTITLSLLFYYFLPDLYTNSTISLMFISGMLCNGKLQYATISFTIHGFLSQFLLSIRGFDTIIVQMSKIGTLSGIVLGTEMYVWLLLLAILFYFKENKNGCNMSSLSQQKH